MSNEAIPYRIALLAAKILNLAGRPLTPESLGGVLRSVGLELDEGYLGDLAQLLGDADTETPLAEPRGVSNNERGAYIYAVVGTGEEVELGAIGIDRRFPAVLPIQ